MFTVHPWRCWHSKDGPRSYPEEGRQKTSARFEPVENDLKSSKTLSTFWFLVDLCLAVFLSGFSFIQPGQTSVVALVQTPSLMMTMSTMMLMMVNMAITQEAGDGDDQNLLCGQVRLADLRQNSLQGGLRSLECSRFFWGSRRG